jgi:hypothetical protein
MAFESTLYRLKVAQIVALLHDPTSPGTCARERAWSGGRAEPRAGADAGGAEAHAGASGAMTRTLG